MISSRNFPSHLKDFWAKFNQLSQRFSYEQTFQDIIVITLSQFCPNPHMEQQHKNAVEKYQDTEKDMINQIVYELIDVYKNQINLNGWADPLGEIYETITSSYKSSMMGQFFTPKGISDLMAQFNITSSVTNNTINDPTCGSGRTLLSAHYQCNYGSNGNTYFGQDKDYICCIMTCLNMLMHGMKGEVVHHDSLRMDFYRGWHIHPIGKYLTPYVTTITEEESIIMKMFNNPDDKKQSVDNVVSDPPQEKGQLSIF